MKYNKGFAPLIILLIVLGVLAVGGVVYFAGKSSAPKNEVADNSNYFPTIEQNYTPPTTNNNPPVQTPPLQNGCTPNDPPSITITNPIAGVSYTVGQNVTLSWTSCNVQNIWLGLGSGGKDFGEITYPNPVPASQGSYQWTATNPAQAFTGSSTNTYFIGFESQSPNVLVKSGNFTVHP